MNPLWHQKKLREFCKANDIHITAYTPLGANGTKWGDNRIIDCDVLKDIAAAKGKTTAQVCILFSTFMRKNQRDLSQRIMFHQAKRFKIFSLSFFHFLKLF